MRRLLSLVPLALLTTPAPADVVAERTGILEALALRSGMTVADVGAGDGRFSVVLAERVGPGGRVYATEIEQAKLDEIGGRARDEGLDNVVAVLGDQTSTGLPEGCCDAILLRLVYHHFTDPAPMRGSLWAALRPGGRIAVIDTRPRQDWPRLSGVPERGGHGIAIDTLLEEMVASGFVVVDRHDAWPGEGDAYCVVFRRPG
ncbi:MAG TPA: methyltransferase domain-containing protein [Vicinamibacteria bacterium]|nr:methyltransferase domain-containing protein [Vicinamibacteria bacterium]